MCALSRELLLESNQVNKIACWNVPGPASFANLLPLCIGDVLTIGSSGVRAFRRWPDMSEENDRISYEMWISWHKINGDLISGPAPFRPIYPPKNQNGDHNYEDSLEPRPKIYRHRRHRVHKMLADQLSRVGIEVEYGQRVVRYEEDLGRKKASVILENGQKIEADLVIAADGIGSRSCSITLGREIRAKPTGVSMYRAMMPVEQALADPVIGEKFPMLDEGRALNQMWMGFVLAGLIKFSSCLLC